jgi:hypothetical protein
VLTKEETQKIKSKAALYARVFLINKYREEYRELYDAYLINRGITPRSQKKKLIDERELIEATDKGETNV